MLSIPQAFVIEANLLNDLKHFPDCQDNLEFQFRSPTASPLRYNVQSKRTEMLRFTNKLELHHLVCVSHGQFVIQPILARHTENAGFKIGEWRHKQVFECIVQGIP